MQSDRYLGDDTARVHLQLNQMLKPLLVKVRKKGREAVEALVREKCFSQKKGD